MQWTKILRRSVAFFLAAVTLWVLTLTGDPGAAAEHLRTLGESGALVEVLLETELGPPPGRGGPLESLKGWEKMVLAQSVRLRAGEGAVAARWGLEEPQVPAPDPVPSPTPPPVLTGSGAGPQILILHTHTTEAYTPDGGNAYQESDSYRTTDPSYNVVHVGDVMAEAFGAQGFTVLHDRTLYDYPRYAGSYGRSGDAVAAYLEKYPSLTLVLDVHRDAIYEKDGTVGRTQNPQNPESAQVLLVVGGNQNDLHPNFQQNLALADRLDEGLERSDPGLSLGVSLRASHYNQQLSPGFLLLEVGSHGNTIAQASLAARAFASSAAVTLKNLPKTPPAQQ